MFKGGAERRDHKRLPHGPPFIFMCMRGLPPGRLSGGIHGHTQALSLTVAPGRLAGGHAPLRHSLGAQSPHVLAHSAAEQLAIGPLSTLD